MDIKVCCRCCLSENKETKSINSYFDVGGKLGQLKEILSDCLNIKADIDDGYPLQVCMPCVDFLKKIHSFKKRVIQSYKYLKQKQDVDIDQAFMVKSENIKTENLNTKEHVFDQFLKIEQDTDIDHNILIIVSESSPNENPKIEKISTIDDQSAEMIDIVPDDEPEYSGFDGDNQSDNNKEVDEDFNCFYCIVCDAKFEKRDQLYKHCCDTHKPLNETGKACQYCNECSPYDSVLALHKKKHLNPLVRLGCTQRFSNSEEYESHLQSSGKHKDSEHKHPKTRQRTKPKAGEKQKRLSQCHFCGKSFSKAYIVSHMKIHQEGQYVCKYCGKVFTQKSPYRTHVNIHLGVNTYNCSYCGKTFKMIQILNSHIKKVHLKKTTKFCDVCGKGYYCNSELAKHMLIHTGMRDVACHLCDKTYVDKTGLRNHLTRHHKLKAKSRLIQPVTSENISTKTS